MNETNELLDQSIQHAGDLDWVAADLEQHHIPHSEFLNVLKKLGESGTAAYIGDGFTVTRILDDHYTIEYRSENRKKAA